MSRQQQVPIRFCRGVISASLTLAAVVVLLVCLPTGVGAAEQAPGGQAAAADQAPGGDPVRGRQLFQEKGCSRCHSVWGHGGTLGPDITVLVAGRTYYELVGAFWNHTPRMIDEMNERGYPWPTLETEQMADVLNYLYYLQLFDDPGNPERGADTYARLQCVSCHALAGQGGRSGGALDHFGVYPSPAPLAQAMWNAGPRMQQEQLRVGRPIPQFTGGEMADLQAFIRAEGQRSGREVELQPLPDPARGAEVYRTKQCGACHDRVAAAPDITRSALSRTASEISGLLWNHSYGMGAAMAARGIAFPRFAGTELSDLIAHLYFRGYLGEDGDPQRGLEVFAQKGCAACHDGGVGGAPDLSTLLEGADRAEMAAAMWNHAPQMHSVMAEEAPLWPTFEAGEMGDLIAYLRTLVRQAADAGGSE